MRLCLEKKVSKNTKIENQNETRSQLLKIRTVNIIYNENWTVWDVILCLVTGFEEN